MSSQNAEALRATFEAFARGDDSALDIADPDIEWHTGADIPDSGVHRGREAVAAFIAEWAESFARFYPEVEEIVDRDEVVIVRLVLRGTMKDADAEIELPRTQVWRSRDGKAVEVREYPTFEEALEATG